LIWKILCEIINLFENLRLSFRKKGAVLNRLHREIKIYFPEYKEAFGRLDGAFSIRLLKKPLFQRISLILGKLVSGIYGVKPS